MPKEIVLLTCLIQWLREGTFPKKLLCWVDQSETTFRIMYQHGNKREKTMTQLEAAQVWLSWDKMKNRLLDFSTMSREEEGKYLTIVRQRFRQALKSLILRKLIIKIETGDTHIQEYRITTEEERASYKLGNESPGSSPPDSPMSSPSQELQVVPGSPVSSTETEQKTYDLSRGNTIHYLIISNDANETIQVLDQNYSILPSGDEMEVFQPIGQIAPEVFRDVASYMDVSSDGNSEEFSPPVCYISQISEQGLAEIPHLSSSPSNNSMDVLSVVDTRSVICSKRSTVINTSEMDYDHHSEDVLETVPESKDVESTQEIALPLDDEVYKELLETLNEDCNQDMLEGDLIGSNALTGTDMFMGTTEDASDRFDLPYLDGDLLDDVL